MLVKTLDEQIYEWYIPEKVVKGNKRRTSLGHSTAKRLLKDLCPVCPIYEEVPILVESNKRLYLDFYIPVINLAAEVHGKQHYEFTSYYHKSKLDFLLSQGNDRKKSEWCELNEIKLVILPYFESETEWLERLMKS
jgi:hypothetical protein